MTATERIDEILNARGMSRRQLAVMAGVPTSSFQAAMARGRNMTIEVLQAVAAALDVSTAYLLGQEAEPLSPALQRAFLSTLLERVDQQLAFADETDVMEEYFGTTAPYADIYEGRGTLTLDRVKEMADELGVPLEYLIAGKNDPADRYSFVDDDLQDQLSAADVRLVDAAHKICGMDPRKPFSPKDWAPAKVDLVREYIKDSQAILKKMISAMETQASTDNG